MKDIILSGIQASGKGTQARLLMDYFGTRLKYFEAGGLLRALQLTPNSIGDYLSSLTKNGILVKDEIIISLWGIFMETIQDGDIIMGDGIFRRMEQTVKIVEKMWDKERLFVVVNLEIPEKEVYKRLAARILCKNCGRTFSTSLEGDMAVCPVCGGALYRRNDDEDTQAIATRLESFHRDTQPCIDWLEEKGLLVHIDGMQSPQKVFQEIIKVMEGKSKD